MMHEDEPALVVFQHYNGTISPLSSSLSQLLVIYTPPDECFPPASGAGPIIIPLIIRPEFDEKRRGGEISSDSNSLRRKLMNERKQKKTNTTIIKEERNVGYID